jgi:hypothetical protein
LLPRASSGAGWGESRVLLRATSSSEPLARRRLLVLVHCARCRQNWLTLALLGGQA